MVTIASLYWEIQDKLVFSSSDVEFRILQKKKIKDTKKIISCKWPNSH